MATVFAKFFDLAGLVLRANATAPFFQSKLTRDIGSDIFAIARQHDAGDPAHFQIGNRLLCRGTDTVFECDEPGKTAINRRQNNGLAPTFVIGNLPGKSALRQSNIKIGKHCLAPDHDLVALDHCLNTGTCFAAEVGDIGNFDALFPCRIDNGTCQRMFTRGLNGCDHTQQFGFICSFSGNDIANRWGAFCQSAGFIKNYSIDVMRLFQRIEIADQDTAFGSRPRPGHQCGWRCKPQCAGARNDQNRNRGNNRCLNTCTEKQPPAKGNQGNHNNHRHKNPGHLVDQFLNRCLSDLRLFNQPNDPRQGCIFADCSHFNIQPPGAIDRTTDNRIAGHTRHGARFPCDKAFIQLTFTG